MTRASNLAKTGEVTDTGGYGFRNRIINGDMRIDQRNSGSSQSALSNYTYTVDRWVFTASQNGKFNSQRNAGSVTPPTGFTNYLGLTVASAFTVGTGDYFFINQRIEGYNMADFAWGTTSAKAATLSFWVYSSLTGTFGGSAQNSTPNYTYPFAYSIPVANTWTYITVTIPGPTAGTWTSDNTSGIQLNLCLGVSSDTSATAGSWTAANKPGTTGAVSVVGTAGATFYITGVQLEAGSIATAFERRPYGMELALCQRYYVDSNPGSSTASYTFITYSPSGAGWPVGPVPLQVTMRAAPSVTTKNTSLTNCSSLAIGSTFPNYFYGSVTVTAAGSYVVTTNYTASAEL